MKKFQRRPRRTPAFACARTTCSCWYVSAPNIRSPVDPLVLLAIPIGRLLERASAGRLGKHAAVITWSVVHHLLKRDTLQAPHVLWAELTLAGVHYAVAKLVHVVLVTIIRRLHVSSGARALPHTLLRLR